MVSLPPPPPFLDDDDDDVSEWIVFEGKINWTPPPAFASGALVAATETGEGEGGSVLAGLEAFATLLSPPFAQEEGEEEEEVFTTEHKDLC